MAGRMDIRKLGGLIPAVVTPFTRDEEIDEDAMRRELRYMRAAGMDGVTLSGSTGEGHTLTIEESCRLARITVDEYKGTGMTVISGIIRDSTREVIQYAKALKAVPGVEAVQITPVHYHPPGEDGNFSYYSDIGDAVQLPIVLYNVVRWNPMEVSTLLKLGETKWVVAVKQSAGDIHKLADLVRAVRASGSPLRVLSAIDALLLPTFVMGAHGSVSAILVVCPHQVGAMWRAYNAGDMEKALDIHEKLLPVARLLGSEPRRAWVKASLELQGRHVGPARRPLIPPSPAQIDAMKEALKASGELSAVAAV